MTMDPDVTLAEMRRLRDKWLHGPDKWNELDIDSLVDEFMALDEWLSRGGYLPYDWQAST